MSGTVLFTQNLQAWQIDVTVEETHKNSLTITKHPVEKGTEMSDHAQINPKIFDLLAGVSDLNDGAWSPGRVAASFDSLKAVQESRKPFTVVSGLTILENMLIEDFTVKQDKETAHVILVRAHLREVKIVGTATTSSSVRPQNTGEAGGFNSDDFSLVAQEGLNKADPLSERGDISVSFEQAVINAADGADAAVLPSLTKAESDAFISFQERTKILDLGGFGGGG